MHVGNWKEREGGGAVADLGKRQRLRREPKGGRRGVTRKRGRVETQLQIWEEGRGGRQLRRVPKGGRKGVF